MILQLITQVSWILWLSLRTRAWYARLARALVRSSVINTAGSKAWFSSYSTSSSDRSSSWVWLARILFGSWPRSSFFWAITRSLVRLLTNLTRSGRGGEGSALVSCRTGLGSPNLWETAISSTCNGGGNFIRTLQNLWTFSHVVPGSSSGNPKILTESRLPCCSRSSIEDSRWTMRCSTLAIFSSFLAISFQGVDLGAECLDGSVQFRGDWVKVIFEQRLKDQRKSLSNLLQLQGSKELGVEIFHYSRLQPGPPCQLGH